MRIALSTVILIASAARGQTPREVALRKAAAALPEVRPELVDDAVTAALGVETAEVSAELLLALAWSESKFDPGTNHGRVCGALQVVPREVGERDSRDACLRWSQDTWQGFQAGVDELLGNDRMDPGDGWMRRSHGNLRLALQGRACGMQGLTVGCNKSWWINRVIRIAAALKRESTR